MRRGFDRSRRPHRLGVGRLRIRLQVNDLRATFALRFRLTRDGPLHLLRQVYILDFHGGDFDVPRFRLLIDAPLEVRIET